MNKDAFNEASELINGDMFYQTNNQKVFKACENLNNQSHPIDLLTVTAQLRHMGELDNVGGAYRITELTNMVTGGENVSFCSQIIYQKYLQREIIRISTVSINKSYEDTTDVFDLIEENQTETFGLLSALNKRDIVGVDELMADCIKDLETPNVDGLTGVGTGFKSIDNITGGWQNTDLIIIAGRPGMAKTCFAMNNARNSAVIHQIPTLIFSLEMSSKQLIQRMVSDESNVLYEKIKRKTLNDYELRTITSNTEALWKSPIFIDDTPALNIFEFRSKARRMKQKHNIGLIIIDYLQLMVGDKPKNSNREQEIGSISRTLKAVAKELNVPIIALSQLSRAVESRKGDNRPQLSDLRESGSIEQDADTVGFLFRPEYYGITEDAQGRSTTGLCELIFGKHRAGVCETVKLDFNGAYMRFKDWKDEAPMNFNNIGAEKDDAPF